MRQMPSGPPRVVTLERATLAPFLASRQIAVVLFGSTDGVNIFPPIVHQLDELYSGVVAFGCLRLPTLSDRAWALQFVERVFSGSAKLRSARRGYYLFLNGQAVAYHPGLYDETVAPLLDRIDRYLAEDRLDEALRLFQQVALEVVRGVVALLDPILEKVAQRTQARMSPHAVLGVPAGATTSEIRTAYRRLLRQNHPDQVRTADPRLLAEAHRRTQAVIQAYRALTR